MKKAWTMATIAILTGIVFVIGLYKVPPTMVLLMSDLQIDMTVVGLTMSVCAIAAMIASLPGGAIMQKFGPKSVGIAAIIMAALGCIIGIVSNNFTVFLIGRALEGASFGIIAIVVTTIIAIWFPAEKRGLPMSIFTLWVSFGMLIIFNVTNLIVPSFGWRGVWWLHLLLLGVFLVLFATVINYPEKQVDSGQQSVQPQVSILEGFKSLGAWILGIIFLLYAVGNVIFNTYYPTFLQQSLGLELSTSNFYTSIATLGMLFCGVTIGIVLNKVKNKNHPFLLFLAMILSTAVSYYQFRITAIAYLPVILFFFGVIWQMVPPILHTIAPDVATGPETIPATLSVVTVCSAVGGMIGPVILGPIVAAANGNWAATGFPLLLILFVGVLASVFLMFMMKKKYQVTKKQETASVEVG
ncbi:MFS transporter [Alkalibacter rhizosphaerae]|uniref:MFS transporter n=1 Tax=Alkalibacter rhizosphaerae TaxID=2815577 RepID=A0A975AH57_9FIRM|nr:MFS transporter [Alkalibacter rhizosphaerae]QSX07658.1 MFS transporter [Alkalibacter rhizosphaerae]